MKLLHTLRRRGGGEAFGQDLGPVGGEGSIQKKEPLLRHGCLMAHRHVNVGIRKVERAESARQKLAVHERIDGTAFVARIEQLSRLSAYGQIEFPARREHPVAQHLKFQPTLGKMRKQPIVVVTTFSLSTPTRGRAGVRCRLSLRAGERAWGEVSPRSTVYWPTDY